MLNKIVELESVGPVFAPDDYTLTAEELKPLLEKVNELVREHNTLVDRVEAMTGIVYER